MRVQAILTMLVFASQLAGRTALAGMIGSSPSELPGGVNCNVQPSGNSAQDYVDAWNKACRTGSTDPQPKCGAALCVAEPTNQQARSTSTATETAPHGGASAAAAAASSAERITGRKDDSQNDTHATTVKLGDYSSKSSRDSGTLDIIEGLLLLPFNAFLGGKFLDSGHKAHRAADEMDSNRQKASDYAKGMNGAGGAAGAPGAGTGNAGAEGGGDGGAGGSGPGANTTGASAPGPFASEHGQELFGKLEDKLGVNRDEFVNAVNLAHGNPQGVGEFMQEKTGSAKYGPDAIGDALEQYAANAGLPKFAAIPGAAPEFAVSSAPSAPTPIVESSVKSTAVALPKQDNELRDRLRKSLAERALEAQRRALASRKGDGTLGKLEPLKDELLEQADRNNSGQEATLFEVVHLKYVEKSQWLEKSR